MSGEGRADGWQWAREARASALQILYHWEVGRLDIERAIETFWEVGRPDEPAPGDRARAYAADLARGTVAELAAIDPLIAGQSAHWRFERLAVVDRLILRLSVYALLHDRRTPRPVVIDEAVELARRFSADEAAGFINGVLDGIRKRIEGEPSEAPPEQS